MAPEARGASLKRERRRQNNTLVRPAGDAGLNFGDDVATQKAVDLLETQLSAGEPWRKRPMSLDGRRHRSLPGAGIDGHAPRKSAVQLPAYPNAIPRRCEGNCAVQSAGQVVRDDPDIRGLKGAQLKNPNG